MPTQYKTMLYNTRPNKTIGDNTSNIEQDKTRQGKTIEDKQRQCNIEWDKRRHDNTRQYTTTQHNIGQDKKTRQYRIIPDKIRQPKARHLIQHGVIETTEDNLYKKNRIRQY